MPSISVIVTTYNWPEAITLVLDALGRQLDRDFEVVVADDGSRHETADALRDSAPRAATRVLHVWHPDRGFRAGAIRNRAIAASRGDYIVFLDGDSLPRPRFVAAHRASAEAGCCVRGPRVLLSESLSARTLAREVAPHRASLGRLALWRLGGTLNRLWPLLGEVLPARQRAGRPSTARPGLHWPALRGVNMALWRSDLERLNGFDEAFHGWGYEDSDLAIRAQRIGLRIRRCAPGSAVLHLHHAAASREREATNRAALEASERSDRVRAEVGLDRSDPEAVVRVLSEG